MTELSDGKGHPAITANPDDVKSPSKWILSMPRDKYSEFRSRVRVGRLTRGLAVCTAVGLAAAASAAAQDVAAPQLVVGDHWQYKITDNLRRGATSQLDAEVIEVTGLGARIRYARTDASGRTQWIDEVDGGGGLRAGSLNREPSRSFEPPAELLAFPLHKGKTWRQVIDTLRRDTGLKAQILIYGRVNGPAATTVPAGRFDTVYVYRTVQLDDDEFWRTRTTRRDAIWYAPSAKAPAREEREAQYTERDGRNFPVRTESILLELVSFQPGAK